MWATFVAGIPTVATADRAFATYAELEFRKGEEQYLRSQALRALRCSEPAREHRLLGRIARWLFRTASTDPSRPCDPTEV